MPKSISRFELFSNVLFLDFLLSGSSQNHILFWKDSRCWNKTWHAVCTCDALQLCKSENYGLGGPKRWPQIRKNIKNKKLFHKYLMSKHRFLCHYDHLMRNQKYNYCPETKWMREKLENVSAMLLTLELIINIPRCHIESRKCFHLIYHTWWV